MDFNASQTVCFDTPNILVISFSLQNQVEFYYFTGRIQVDNGVEFISKALDK